MSLDIGIPLSKSSMLDRSEPRLSLEDDGYYWFLHPLFENLEAETGQYIDLYGGASFGGEKLLSLERMLRAARELIESQPTTWQVRVATEVLSPGESGTPKEIWNSVRRDEFLKLWAEWERVVVRAKNWVAPSFAWGIDAVCAGRARFTVTVMVSSEKAKRMVELAELYRCIVSELDRRRSVGESMTVILDLCEGARPIPIGRNFGRLTMPTCRR